MGFLRNLFRRSLPQSSTTADLSGFVEAGSNIIRIARIHEIELIQKAALESPNPWTLEDAYQYMNNRIGELRQKA